MPATPKSPRLKKSVGPAALKPKGAVRAKSGCYTCRIRRKKCDEKRINNGVITCETCSRLKLECLGFGAKRPDWLRETSRIQEIRDRIKNHLAAQGMIKGHAGTGQRPVIQEDILVLSHYPGPGDAHAQMQYPSGGSSSSASTPRRDESVESDDRSPYLMPNPYNHFRGGGFPGYEQPFAVHSDMPSRSDSPFDNSMAGQLEFDQIQDLERNYNTTPSLTPAIRSSFSKFYGELPLALQELYSFEDTEDFTRYSTPPTTAQDTLVTHTHPSRILPNEIFNQSLRHYVEDVVKIQYLFGDKRSLPEMIWKAIHSHQDSYTAVTLLSKAYYGRQENPGFIVLADSQVCDSLLTLRESLEMSRQLSLFTVDNAMTALHIVSLYLFDGGRGAWNTFLSLAVHYVEQYLTPLSPLHNYAIPQIMEAASPKDQFVIKTTIWFDVLASITTQKPPELLKVIEALFDPVLGQSYVDKPTTYSMMTPMGCENTVVWAMAKTTTLASWKKKHERAGDLSVFELLRRVHEIDEYLQPGPQPSKPPPTPEDYARYLASEMFRTATRLLLMTVGSGDYPNVPEVKTAVKDAYAAICAIEQIQNYIHEMQLSNSHHGYDYQTAIVRSTVFAIFLCGAFTTEAAEREQLTRYLQSYSGHEVGNCTEITRLLSELWNERYPGPGKSTPKSSTPVRWRHTLRQATVLLV